MSAIQKRDSGRHEGKSSGGRITQHAEVVRMTKVEWLRWMRVLSMNRGSAVCAAGQYLASDCLPCKEVEARTRQEGRKATRGDMTEKDGKRWWNYGQHGHMSKDCKNSLHFHGWDGEEREPQGTTSVGACMHCRRIVSMDGTETAGDVGALQWLTRSRLESTVAQSSARTLRHFIQGGPVRRIRDCQGE